MESSYQTESFLTACISLVHEPDKPWLSLNSRRVRTHEKNSGKTVRRLGTIIQIILLCPIRSQHWLDRLEMVRWESVPSRADPHWDPRAFPPVLENVRRAFSSRPWVSEDGIGEESRESKTLFPQYFANLAVLACSRRSYGGEVRISFFTLLEFDEANEQLRQITKEIFRATTNCCLSPLN